ncbi:TPA: hypothetical protein ACQGXN_004086 [Pseudomonas aeruginosa]|uniref:hypothetical protein n=1 Tax=Pseudomonas aeruginosa TaxID=287 RepID=UPI001296EAD1|nr:hypothetical protein [Pseudomonas aeruginosa]MBG6661688.1 hypothetical protein [Pseudomonas aeruginosa]MBV5675701.1 hypothetical protein [Pseudomonas aeruginosa]MDP5493971.1 hypothetical protein [Pseudomonas aeruginosa]HCE6668017.1 hypothetical protein [Pseudomonas aeruginosa]HCF0167733.1 hypothetical protein [Pseudomonas aeruginosa]
MNFENVSLMEWMTLLVAVLGLWIPVRVFSKNNNKELFQLRQRVVNKVEEARSGWHALNRENNSLIKRTQTDSSIPAELKSMLIEFLEGQGEAFNLWITDANALANDVQVNIGSFNEKKCREYLLKVEPAIEMLTRNQGVAEKKYNETLSNLPSKLHKDI